MALADVLLFGLTMFAVRMIWIPFWPAGVTNGAGHFWGYRNFPLENASSNIMPCGILIGGEELHNNHHSNFFSSRMRSPAHFRLLPATRRQSTTLLPLARVVAQV